MKRLVLALMLISFVNTYSKECTCGSFEVGLYDYEVKGDKGCCSGTATGIGFLTLYEYSESGTWEVVGFKEMLGADAQRACCFNA